MTNFFKNKQKGISILGIIFFGFILILILSYFNISIKSVVESPTGQENVGFINSTSTSLWNNYLAKPVNYIWNDIIMNIFWKPFISNMERLRDGKPTDLEEKSSSSSAF